MKNFVNNVRSVRIPEVEVVSLFGYTEFSWCKFWLENSGIKNVKRIKLKILSAAVVF